MPRIKNFGRVEKSGELTEVEWEHTPTGMRVALEEVPNDEEYSPEHGKMRSGAAWVVVITGNGEDSTKSYLGKNEGYDAATNWLRKNTNVEPGSEDWDPEAAAEELGVEALGGWVTSSGPVAVTSGDSGFDVVTSDGTRNFRTRFEAVAYVENELL